MTSILDLEGRVALVTGAGQGLGREIALLLANAENSGGVAVNDYHFERAQAVAHEIIENGGKAFPVQADVTDTAAVKEMVNSIAKELGPVGVLVNNAGNHGPNPTADIRKPFWETGPDTWKHSIDVNFYGTINCVSAVIPGMIERKAPGRIITVISDAARNGEPGLEIYGAAKAGAAGLTRGIARSLGRYNITANNISISATETPAIAERMKDKELMKKVLSKYVIRRFGKPSEIAKMALFLSSDAGEWITGQTYPVNGGFSLTL